MAESWSISREIRHGEIQYTIRWSPWGPLDKWVINRIVPSEAGLFQIWVLEKSGLTLLVTEPTFFGGLRNSLREAIDELAPAGNRLRTMIDGRESWFRFSISSSRSYLDELKNWFGGTGEMVDAEGREILVHEAEDWRRFPEPPPEVQKTDRNRMRDADFGPPLPNNV